MGSDEEIKSHFAQFGQIAQVEQPFDKTKSERKNFCFITFEKEDSAKQLLKAGTTIINGVELEVKKVTPKPDPRAMGMAVGMVTIMEVVVMEHTLTHTGMEDGVDMVAMEVAGTEDLQGDMELKWAQ